MATVQIRELPEDSYETLRRRARRAGQSMQAYMRDQLVTLAARPTKEEAIEAIEAALERLDLPDPSGDEIVADRDAERR